MRCRISNYFSIKYGVLGYKNADNFVNGIYYNDFVEDMEKEINRNSKAPFVKNFKTNYENGDIPFYALVELFSFGTLSKFYKTWRILTKGYCKFIWHRLYISWKLDWKYCFCA